QLDGSRWDELKAIFAETFQTKDRDEWAAIFEGTDACTSPILNFVEATEDPHLAARGTLVEIAGVTQAQVAPRFARATPATPTGPAREATDPATVWQD
ncbi:CoA transferase, partial [Gordonia sp. VNK21]|uniref:CoA transferase n=1 Tax=Gordonia sp. VNK21 TaxID=3382483 RepID=UPI0038D3C6C8